MLATHTPGPWQALGLGSDLRGANGEPIALIHVLGSAQRETGEANARLIAEAPAMLELIRYMAEHWPVMRLDQPGSDAYIRASFILARIDGKA